MIYWFTGQPSHGKTVLASLLKEYLVEEKRKTVGETLFMIDGDDMRELFSNKDYSINGRVNNVATAQRIAHYLHNQGHDVIVSLVAPYVDQREDFKQLIGTTNIVEFYVHTSEPRERDHFRAIAYLPPVSDYVDVDTTKDSPEESLEIIKKWIK
jgi:adenylylsulfate kinase-like enzyme